MAARSAWPLPAMSLSASTRPSRADRTSGRSAGSGARPCGASGGLLDRQDPPRVRFGHRRDLWLGDTRRAQAWKECLDQVDVSVAAVVLELGVVSDVLAEQDPIGVAATEEVAQKLDDAVFAESLDRRERHPEEVELDARTAFDDAEVVVEDRVRVGMADDDARRIDALLLEDAEQRQPDRREDRVGRDG